MPISTFAWLSIANGNSDRLQCVVFGLVAHPSSVLSVESSDTEASMDPSSGAPTLVNPASLLPSNPMDWSQYPSNPYTTILDDNLSDSDSSGEAAAYGLYYPQVAGHSDVATEILPVFNAGPTMSAVHAPNEVSYGWTYEIPGTEELVTSPNSATTDTSVTEHTDPYLASTVHVDPSMAMYTEEYSTDDSDESYSSTTTASTTTNSATESPGCPNSVSGLASGRPVRISARGDQIKQVHEMIRQVNSAVEPAVKTPKTKQKENSKKRARVEPDIRNVTLSREQLLTMTSEELDEFTARLKADHPLTPHELRELKRQRRLIKNREYAQASRVKKKVVLSDLGNKFQELESERAQLIARCQLLEAENAALREQLALPPAQRSLIPFMTQSTNTTAPAKKESSDPDDFIFQPPKSKRPRGRAYATPIIGGGLSLFAIALLVITAFSSNLLPWSGTVTPTPPHGPTTVASKIEFHSNNEYNTFRTMDILQSTPETTIDPSTVLNPEEELTPPDTKLHTHIETIATPTLPIQSTMASMEDLLTAEDGMEFTTNINTTIEHLPVAA